MNHPRIATAPDRRAYQALTNVRRLHNYRQQMARLERECDRLTRTLVKDERAGAYDIHAITRAIQAGHRALYAGQRHEQALATALNSLEE